MSFDVDTLYRLLPAVYRLRDAEGDGVLRELIQVIAEQVGVLEEDLEQLYDDQFIETCADWAIPYIGDLIGYRDLYDVSPHLGSSRAEVANTIAYRRRKGTASMLEQLARDVTGWDTAVVEFFQRLATTQYLNHLRPAKGGSADIRRLASSGLLGTPFETTAHTADVRHIASCGGRYNIPNVGIFVWRIRSFALLDATPAAVDRRRYHFHPLGLDMPLYCRPETETEITHLATANNVSLPLSRRFLALHLNQHYGPEASLSVSRGGQAIDVAQVRVCDLSDGPAGQWANMPTSGVTIDPQLGRLAFSEDVDTATTPLRVSYRYGFSAEIAGGGYSRAASLDAVPVTARHVPDAFSTLQAALGDEPTHGMVSIKGNGRYTEDLSTWVAADERLHLQASDQARPAVVLNGDFEIGGDDGAEMVIDGLMIAGGALRIPATMNGRTNRLQRLTLRHCTLMPGIVLAADGTPQQPGTPSIVVEIPNLVLELESCIVGPLAVASNNRVRIRNGIVDANDSQALAYDGGSSELQIGNSTVIGRVETHTLPLASNTIFLGAVDVNMVQAGCVRFSYLSLASHVPRRYRCQPSDRDCDNAPPVPWFTSLRYGDVGYAQLRPGCAAEIRTGADDESEMGVFYHLRQPQREANLRERLDEYLRFGLEAGIFYAS